jgi:hypothetical protein
MKTQAYHLGAALLASLALAGCGADGADGATGDTCKTGETQAAIITELGFTRELKPGEAPGFNLDGKVSDGSDYLSCGKVDYTDPDGNKGIDNQLAGLVPEVEKLVGNAVDGLIKGAINDGQLVILMEMEGVDDLVNDPCVNVAVQIGEKRPPSLGTDGVIEAYQTFTLDPKAERSHAEGARIENGVLTAGPFELAIPIAIFDVAFTLHVRDARIRFVIDEEGKMQGYLGGGVVPEEIVDGVKNGAGLADLIPKIRVALEASTDLAYSDDTGKCGQLSAALAIHTVPAFIRK